MVKSFISVAKIIIEFFKNKLELLNIYIPLLTDMAKTKYDSEIEKKKGGKKIMLFKKSKAVSITYWIYAVIPIISFTKLNWFRPERNSSPT